MTDDESLPPPSYDDSKGHEMYKPPTLIGNESSETSTYKPKLIDNESSETSTYKPKLIGNESSETPTDKPNPTGNESSGTPTDKPKPRFAKGDFIIGTQRQADHTFEMFEVLEVKDDSYMLKNMNKFIAGELKNSLEYDFTQKGLIHYIDGFYKKIPIDDKVAEELKIKYSKSADPGFKALFNEYNDKNGYNKTGTTTLERIKRILQKRSAEGWVYNDDDDGDNGDEAIINTFLCQCSEDDKFVNQIYRDHNGEKCTNTCSIKGGKKKRKTQKKKKVTKKRNTKKRRTTQKNANKFCYDNYVVAKENQKTILKIH